MTVSCMLHRSYGGTHLPSRLRLQPVVSTEKRLTAVFGMGTGVSTSRNSTTIATCNRHQKQIYFLWLLSAKLCVLVKD